MYITLSQNISSWLELLGARIFVGFRMKWNFFLRRLNVESFFTGSTPLDRVNHTTPVVGTSGMLHGSFHHFQFLVLALSHRILAPMRWNGVVNFQFVINILPVRWVIVHKNGTAPLPRPELAKTFAYPKSKLATKQTKPPFERLPVPLSI